MPAQNISKLGNPKLATPSLPITQFATPELYTLIKDMHATMLEKGGVGLAAPQIGHNVRVIMFGFEKSARYPNEKPVPFTILVNPTIEFLSDEKEESWEGCLSIPGLRGAVPRYKKIKYTGYTPEGEVISRTAENFHARVVQHECDHLDGILFPQRMTNIRNLAFEDELQKLTIAKNSARS